MSRCPECGDGLNDEERADLYARLERAERQRDELLAALREAIDDGRDCLWHDVGEPAHCQRCTRHAALIASMTAPKETPDANR